MVPAHGVTPNICPAPEGARCSHSEEESAPCRERSSAVPSCREGGRGGEAAEMAHSSRNAEDAAELEKEAAELETEAGEEPEDQESPPVTQRAVDQCDISSWYPTFRHASIGSEIIPLPEDFVAFLLQDGLHLPATSQALPRRESAGEWEAHTDDYTPWEDSEDTTEEPEVPAFPELERAVDAAVEKLGGAVIPKLNWSSPKDATWLSCSGTLKCTNAAEVFLMLKGSDSVTHDLCHAYDACTTQEKRRPQTFVLCLRRWLGFRPEMEFRCFIRNQKLIGISQREVTSFYPVHSDEQEMRRVHSLISAFFSDHICGRFPEPDYTMDVYVSRKGTVKLVDFNPFGGSTLPLLYTWEELLAVGAPLRQPATPPTCDAAAGASDDDVQGTRAGAPGEEGDEGEVELRLVTSSQAVRPSLRALSGAPFDLRDGSPGGSADELLQKLMSMDARGGS